MYSIPFQFINFASFPEEELLIVLEIFISLAVVIIEVWFLTIVLKAYSFFTDKYNYTGGDREDNV